MAWATLTGRPRSDVPRRRENVLNQTEHLDALIIGGGLSGIGAACHLQSKSPQSEYAILESRGSMGGTWDLFRYPGIRSDSDMHTLGYDFKPWEAAKSIADGPSILAYIHETAREYKVEDKVRYHHRAVAAHWDSESCLWTVEVERSDTGERLTLSCKMVLMCSGYYKYEEGYTPEFVGKDLFDGLIVHPQHWPEDLDYENKRVVVIGSGATAMTLVPAMAEKAEEVVMLQRSPTYVVSRPAKDVIANFLRRFLSPKLAYALTRFKNVRMQQFVYRRSRTKPERMKEILIDQVRKELGPDFDVETHFTPSYNPWDQRLCLVPDGDLFDALRSGKASVKTAEIDSFTKEGLRLKSGEELRADIIITATGLNMSVLGGLSFTVDGQALDLSDTWSYKGVMCSGLPNLVFTFGYINASWTLRSDLVSEYFCRLLNHMDKNGYSKVVPAVHEDEESMPARPWIDEFSSGYMARSLHLFPKQSDQDPWRNTQNYSLDKKMLKEGPLEDQSLIFTGAREARANLDALDVAS